MVSRPTFFQSPRNARSHRHLLLALALLSVPVEGWLSSGSRHPSATPCSSNVFASEAAPSVHGRRAAQASRENGSERQDPLRDCVCLVTGASRGIGKGVAIELGRMGATVYVTGTSSRAHVSTTTEHGTTVSQYVTSSDTGGPGTIEETAEQVSQLGGTGIPIYCNHADDEQVQALMETIRQNHGRLDILVNNVFRLPRDTGLQRLQSAFYEDSVRAVRTWDALHTVGVRAHYVATCTAMPLLLRTNETAEEASGLPRPLVVMVSSFGGVSYTFNVAYGVGKCAVDRMVKDMDAELRMNGPREICFASLYPGVVATERTQLSVDTGDWQRYVGIPLDFAESPNLTGRAVVALALDRNNMKKSGSVQVVAELAQEYGVTETDGQPPPPSIRSLRFLLYTYALDDRLRQMVPQWMIPDWKLPFWVMASGRPPKPSEKGVQRKS